MSTSAPEFTITHTLNVRRELVWRAWTEKKELAAWLPSTPLESISFDIREGGRYRYTMVNVETGEEYPTGGVFLDVVPFERLVCTWGYPDDPIENSPVVTLTLLYRFRNSVILSRIGLCIWRMGNISVSPS
ncbi:SRPBCC family protein [Paenibacillus oleatilyticus]|uniref:SRPBCC domain-containing protein n=1 Tax=Paenibacillus oleatilyticus TaxID=2594886 RepID=A0ABV4V5L6_9BACL